MEILTIWSDIFLLTGQFDGSRPNMYWKKAYHKDIELYTVPVVYHLSLGHGAGKLNQDLQRFHNNCEEWKLKVNISKTV